MNEAQRLLRAGTAGAAAFAMSLARRFIDDRSLQAAGSLTFTTLLAIVPLATVALSLSTAFPVFDEAIAALQRYIVEHFLPDASGVSSIAGWITEFTEKAGRLTAVGLAILAITALMLMLTIDDVLNRVFRVARKRPLAQRLLMYWGVLTLGPVLIGASLSMTSLVVGVSLGMLGDVAGAPRLILAVLPVLFTCAALTMLYLVVPHRSIQIRHALIGGIGASVVFEFAKRGFAFYIAQFPTYALIYGAFATVPVFLLWLYLSWLIVLAGATLAAMLPGGRDFRSGRVHVAGSDLLDVLAILVALVQEQQARRVHTLNRLAAQVRIPPDRCESLLERCLPAGWVARTERDGWLLACDAGALRVADVYSRFVLDPGASAEAIQVRLSQHWQHVDANFGISLQDLVAKDDGAGASKPG